MARVKCTPFLHFLSLLIVLVILQACTSIPNAQRSDKRAQLDREADETITDMLDQNPGIRKELELRTGKMQSSTRGE